MIDWLALSLPGESAPELENMHCLGTDSFRGNLSNLLIKQTAAGVFCCGSLGKYLSGNNVMDMTRTLCQDALAKA